METVIGDCPLGAKCETPGVRDGKDVIVRCPWFIKVKGINPQDGKEVDNWNCAIAWMPMLSINIADQARQGTAATTSFRNVMVEEGEKTRKTLSLVDNSK